MELVEGEDLSQLLDQRKQPFSEDEAFDWMRQLLDALDYLHCLTPPIIHRDIKPANLKLTGRKRLKLLDFGIAKSGERSAGTTRNQTFVGATLDYSPIEQILRVIDATFREFIILKHEAKARAVLAQNTDVRADIFAAGGTFYHLLTNTVPEDATKRTLEVWEGKPDPLTHPSQLCSDVSNPMGNFLLKAMAIDREDRFASAAEMLDALNGVATETFSLASATQAKTERLIVSKSSHETVAVMPEIVYAETERLISRPSRDEIPGTLEIVAPSRTEAALETDVSTDPTVADIKFASTIENVAFILTDIRIGEISKIPAVSLLHQPETESEDPQMMKPLSPELLPVAASSFVDSGSIHNGSVAATQKKKRGSLPIRLGLMAVGFLLVASIAVAAWLIGFGGLSLGPPANKGAAVNAEVNTPAQGSPANINADGLPNPSPTSDDPELPSYTNTNANGASNTKTQTAGRKTERPRPEVVRPDQVPAKGKPTTAKLPSKPKDLNCMFTNSCK